MSSVFLRHMCLFLLVLTVTALQAQSPVQIGTISGKIVDNDTGTPLEAVNVQFTNTNLGATTDADGVFSVAQIPAGEYSLTISRVGYATKTETVQVQAGETTKLTIMLFVQPIEMDAVVVHREMLIGDPTKLNGIPGSAHFISNAELKKQNFSDIHRALRKVPGVNVQEEDGYGLRPNIGFRGTGVERSEKITLMEDGVLIAPAPYAAPAAYYFPTVGRMEGIEIRKGSSQIKYGPYTTGGALNLISAAIPDIRSGNFYLAAGEGGARTINGKIGQSGNNYGFMLQTYQASADGFKELDNGGNTGFDKEDYLAKFQLHNSMASDVYHSLSLKVGYTDELSNETYLGLTDADFLLTPYRRYAGSQEDQMDSEHRQYQLRYFMRPTPLFDISVTGYRNEFKRNWYKLDKVQADAASDKVSISSVLASPSSHVAEYSVLTGLNSDANALSVKANNREYYSQGVQSFAGFRFGNDARSHEFEAGIRYHQDEMDRFQWVDGYQMSDGVMSLTSAGVPGTESNRIESATAFATFLQYTLNWDRFTVSPGVRYEDITISREDFGKADPDRTGSDVSNRENHVTVTVPGIGLDYRVNSAVTVFAGVHKGFAPPGSSEGTEPESSVNYELGGRYGSQDTHIGIVAFYNDYRNLLGSDLNAAGGTGSGDLFNGGEVLVKGMELSASTDISFSSNTALHFPIRTSYTFTSAVFENDFESDYGPWSVVESGDYLPYLPKHVFSASIGLETSRFSAELSSKFMGEMRTAAGQGTIASAELITSHLVTDISGGYKFYGDHQVVVSVRNLSDETYVAARRPAGARPGLPRTFLVGIRTGF